MRPVSLALTNFELGVTNFDLCMVMWHAACKSFPRVPNQFLLAVKGKEDVT